MAEDLTELIHAARSGDVDSRDRLIAVMEKELRILAGKVGAQKDRTLSPTALVNEAYLKIAHKDLIFEDRVHFLSSMARVMRQVLLDYVRGEARAKRGGGMVRADALEPDQLGRHAAEFSLLVEGLEILTEINPRQAAVLQLKSFAGLTNVEIARGLRVSEATVRNDLKSGRAWFSSWAKRSQRN